MLLEIIGAILSMVGSWMIFKKMGRQGWEGIVPIYSTYVLCKVLYGNGWKFLLLLIPFYNIYFAIKMMVDLAKAFNQGVGFAIGLLLLPFVFNLILAFGGAQYMDGSFCQHPARHGGGRGQQGQGCRVRRPERPVNIKKLRPGRSFLTLDRIKRGEAASLSPFYAIPYFPKYRFSRPSKALPWRASSRAISWTVS